MTFDIPHMIASGIVILAAIWFVDHTNAFEGATKGRKTLMKFLILFVVLFLLNLVWPYGATA